MNIKAILLGTAACAVLAAPAFAQEVAAADAPKPHHHHHQAATTGSDRLDLLEKRVEQQADEIDALKAQINGAPASGNVSSAEFEALQNQVYETQAAVKSASTPKDKKIHFKGVTVTFGGFAAAELVYRSANEESDIGSNYTKIPFSGPGYSGSPTSLSSSVSAGHMGEFRMTARQSRISGLAEGNFDADTHFTYYGEFDFLGAAQTANSGESNSYQPRIRNLYGTVDWSNLGLEFLYGQSWSLVTLTGKGMSERTEMAPPTIEAQYVPGFDWKRQPQLRIVKDFDDQVWLGLSVENPQTSYGGNAPSNVGLVTGSTGVAELSNANTFSFNHIPDVIGKIAVEPDMFDHNVHLEAFGIYRDFYDRSAPGTTPTSVATVVNRDTGAGGVGAAALIKVIPGWFDLQADGMFGSGIGSYGAGQLPDATYGYNGQPKALKENMEMVGATLHATHDLDIYVFGGQEQDDHSSFGSKYGYGNPLVDNRGCYSFAANSSSASTYGCTANVKQVEQITAGLWDTAYSGDFGKFKIGLQYSYTELKAFGGDDAGGSAMLAPHTKDNMIFTSFRYYPF